MGFLKGLAKTAIDPMGMGLGDAVFGKAKGPNYAAEQAELKRIKEEKDKAYDEFIKNGGAKYQTGEKINYEQLDPETLAKLGDSELGGIQTDAGLHDTELAALRQLEEQGRTGLTDRDRADQAKLTSDVNRQQAGRLGAIKQNMAAKGIGGSGMDMLAQLSTEQDATDREALGAIEQSALAADRRTQGIAQAGQMAGQMSNEEYQRKANAARANDSNKRFNTENTVTQQRANNTGVNQANQANWKRTNNTNDRQTDADHSWSREKLGAQQGKNDLDYDFAAGNLNKRMQSDKAEVDAAGGKMGAVVGTVGSIFGGIYGGPEGAKAGGKLGYAVGDQTGRTQYQNSYYEGGYVDGEEITEFDEPINDTVDAKLSPGEIVIPKTIAKDPAAAAHFVAKENQKQASAIDPSILEHMAKSDPELVGQYKARMGKGDEGVAKAQKTQDMMSYANTAGDLLNKYSNSQKRDIILENGINHLADPQKVIKADRPEYDGSDLDAAGKQAVDRAKEERANGQNEFMNEQKVGDMARTNSDKDLLRQAAARANNSTSEESAFAREFLKKQVPGIENTPNFDKMTATMASKFAPDLSKAYQSEQNRKAHSSDIKTQVDARTSAGDERATNSANKQNTAVSMKLSDKYNKDGVTVATGEVRTAAAKAEGLVKTPSPSNDTALIYNFMRANDPGSTVRESEFALATNRASLPAKVQGYLTMMESGQLTTEKRLEILASIRNLAKSQESRQAETDEYYTNQSNHYGADPDFVIGKKRSTFNEDGKAKAAPTNKRATQISDLPDLIK